MRPALQQKIDRAISIIRKGEPLALSYHPDGYLLGFSGGKDSQVVYELARLAGVKFKAIMNRTTIEPIEVITFTRNHYPDVEIVHPKDKEGRATNFYAAIKRHGGKLPSRAVRWCCSEFKEIAGDGRVVITGVRQSESARRRVQNPTPMKAYGTAKRMAEVESEHSSITPQGKLGRRVIKHIDLFDIDNDSLVKCVNGADQIVVSPIYDWSERDVWEFLNDAITPPLPHCELYDQGFKRIGCAFCPMSNTKARQRDKERFPQIYKAIKKTLEECFDQGHSKEFDTAEELLDWYINSEDTVSVWRQKQKQLKINFNNE